MSQLNIQDPTLDDLAYDAEVVSKEISSTDQLKVDRIAIILRERIINGDYKPGQRIPSINKLAADDQIDGSRNSVTKAMRILKEEGTILTFYKIGSFISDDNKTSIINYKDIAEVIRERIDSGEYEFALPTYIELGTEFQKTCGTIRKAIKEIEKNYDIFREFKRAYIGKNGKRDFMEAQFRKLYPDRVPSRSELSYNHEALYRQLSRYQQRTGDMLLDRLVPATQENIDLGHKLREFVQGIN